MTEKATPSQIEQYLSTKGNLCLYCQSNDIECFETEYEGLFAIQSVQCLDCEAYWGDVYVLAGVRDLNPS